MIGHCRNDERGLRMADAGWYPDPQDADSEAYFDGAAWTGERRPRPVPPPAGLTTPAWQPPPAAEHQPPTQYPAPAPYQPPPTQYQRPAPYQPPTDNQPPADY